SIRRFRRPLRGPRPIACPAVAGPRWAASPRAGGGRASGPVFALFVGLPAGGSCIRPGEKGSRMLHLKGRLGKGATIAAASAAVLVAGTGIAVAGASGPNITRATTIRLVARGGTSTFVNVRHQKRPGVGDQIILSQP